MTKLIPILFVFLSLQLSGQKAIPLYPSTIPNSIPSQMKEEKLDENGELLGFRNISEPTLAVYLPDDKIASGAAVVICPGGGYGMECYRDEGIEIAETFVKNGVAAFILKYR